MSRAPSPTRSLEPHRDYDSTVNRFPLVEAAGSAYEMGYAHGAQAAALIERYLGFIEKRTGRDRAALGAGALTYVPFIEALSPAYLEEVRGLADGAEMSFEEAMICQVVRRRRTTCR